MFKASARLGCRVARCGLGDTRWAYQRQARLELNRDEQRDLRAFLEALTDHEFLEDPAFADPDL
jgi:hypothetical protein